MAIKDRIKEAIDKLNLNDPINAMIQVSIAIDGTAKKEYPGKKTSFRCKKFLEKNRGFISRVAFGKLEIQGPMLFQLTNSNNPKDGKTLEEVLYHLVRCSLIHEGELPKEVEITSDSKIFIGMTNDGKVLISTKLIWAMVFAVIGSKVNTSERLPAGYSASIKNLTVDINDLWGNGEKIYKIVKDHNQ
jgi:hypothetical protein